MNGYTNGLVNTHSGTSTPVDGYHQDSVHNEPGSSTGYHPNGFSTPPYRPNHNEEIVDHLYHFGYQGGNYADTILHVHKRAWKLHAIILSRSPFLAHLMSTSPSTGQRVIHVPLDNEPEVTEEAFAIALGYLYSSKSLSLIRPDNARAILAAGCLLGGMDDLCQIAYDVCRQSINVENIGSWLEFIDTLPSAPSSPGTPAETPSSPLSLPLTIFGSYSQRLRDDVFHFLVMTLPELLDVQSPSDSVQEVSDKSGRDVLLQIYSRVPFEMFKAAVESPTFQIGSDQARFQFAKDAIALRKRGIARGPGAEETVVLAFGGSNYGGSAVHVTRKMRKRTLWKVNS